MRVRQWRFTTISAIELGAAIFLTLVALIIGYTAYCDMRLYFSFRAGMRQFGSREWGKAQQSFQDARKFDPDYPYSIEFLAMIMTYMGELDEAEKLYNEYLSKFKKPLPAHIGLAVIAMKRYDAGGQKDKALLEEAVRHLEEARKISPKCAEIPINFAQIALLQGKREEARRYLDEVERERMLPTLDGLVDYYTMRGVLAYAKGTPEGSAMAAREFRKAWHVAPERVIPLANFAFMEGKRLADPATASDILDDSKVGRLREMITNMQYIYDLDRERNAALRDALYCIRIGWALAYYNKRRNVMEAEDKLNYAIMNDPRRPEAILWKAHLHLLESKMPDVREDRKIFHMHEARKNYHEVIEGHVDRRWIPDVSATLLATCNNNVAVLDMRTAGDTIKSSRHIVCKSAAAKLKDALKLEPNNPILLRNLAIVYDWWLDRENALLHYRKSLALKPDQKDVEERIKMLEMQE